MKDLIYLIIIILPIIAYSYSKYIYSKYKKEIKDTSSFTVVRNLLDENKLDDVHVVKIATLLPSHFDTKRKVIRLTDEAFDNNNLTAITIATHECSHALLYKDSIYNKILSFLFPIFDLICKFCYPVLFISILILDKVILELSVMLILCVILYQMISYVNEQKASNNAYNILKNIYEEDADKINEILLITNFTFLTLPVKYLIDYMNIIVKKIKG